MLVEDILAAPIEHRRFLFSQLSAEERVAVLRTFDSELDNPFFRWRNDPVGFVTEGLRENVWSKQIEILESVKNNVRTAVPACHAPGKSHIAARAIVWWVMSHPIDKVRVVTTATTLRQVKSILWPHIRRIVAQHNLPGDVLTVEWKINEVLVADGFSPADHNESAVQGIHAEHLLVVVDEAGGISMTIGNALEALMTGGHTRMLLLGNPPTDNLNSWFERCCNNGLFNVIRIPADSTPNFTGEHVGEWSKNLVDQRWVDDVVRSFGQDAPFVQARVHARFPRTSTSSTIPVDWVDMARLNEPDTGPIRLGVDVAAEGGDEFAIAQVNGLTARLVHASKNNRSPVEVAGVVLEHILRVEKESVALGIPDRVRIKIDAIGLGWGVAGLLKSWGDEGKHSSEVIAVNVAQVARRKERFQNQRAEMWWNGRELMQPDADGKSLLCLNVDDVTAAQLSGPSYFTTSNGRIQIESKPDMNKRGLQSPDRAEAVLLALYEPKSVSTTDFAPISIEGSNDWASF